MTGAEHVFRDISLVVGTAAILSWLALVLRQPIIVAYLVCGMVLGPLGFSVVGDLPFIHEVGRIGVTLLLFLAGIVLHPRRLIALFRESALVTLGTCASSAILAGVFAAAWGFRLKDSLYIGLALMFSSTILVVKLMPTTALHHRQMGATCIAILIAEDLIAVVLLLFISGSTSLTFLALMLLVLKAILLVGVGLAAEQYILRKMMAYSDRFHETLYMLALGWCLGMATLAAMLGFSFEVGAFVAGVALARSPISLFLSERLKPFRDFFLVLFFFVLGAELDLALVRATLLPALVLAALILTAKPVIRRAFFLLMGEQKAFASEVSIRMGQASEFSLIIASFAFQVGYVSKEASQLVQLATILTMAVSSYLIVARYPTPLGTRKSGLQQD